MKPLRRNGRKDECRTAGAVNDSHLLVYYPVESFLGTFLTLISAPQTCWYYKEGP